MYCKHCGSEISDRAKVCPHCGTPTEKGENPKSPNKIVMGSFVFSIITIFGALIFNMVIHDTLTNELDFLMMSSPIILVAVASLIWCIVGYKKSSSAQGTLAAVGIAISIIAIIMTVIFIVYDIIDANTVRYVPVH